MDVDTSAMLGLDLWAVRWHPADGVGESDLAPVLDDHLAWMLGLERDGHLVASGPLTSGPGVRAGAGLTVLRARSAEDAADLAAHDPFVRKGLREPEVLGWRVMEGAISVRVSFGTGTYRLG